MAKAVETLEKFQSILNEHNKVMVDFSASWCGPCKVIGPVFENLAEVHGKDIYFMKVDVDEASDIAETYEISALPTIKCFIKGKPSQSLTVRGADVSKLKKLVEVFLKTN